MPGYTPQIARQTLKSLSPFVSLEVLNKGLLNNGLRLLCSPTICYFRKMCSKQKFRGKKSPPKPELSLFSFHDNLLKNSIKRAV